MYTVNGAHWTLTTVMGPQYVKASKLIRDLQGVGTEQLESTGVTHADLTLEQKIFVLAKLTAKFIRAPKYNDDVIFSTWPHKEVGARFIRNYTVGDADQNIMVEVVTSWICINPVTKKILKPSQVDIGLEYCEDTLSIDGTDRFRCPGEYKHLKQREVGYSDLDVNSHVNNTTYLDIICDCIKLNSSKQIDIVNIEFKSEAVQGDVFDIEMYSDKKETWIKGTHDRGLSFSGYIKLK